MKAHVAAIKAFLAPLAYDTHTVWVPSPIPAQYVVLGVKGAEPGSELPLCGTHQVLDTDIRVKAVTGTPDGVLIMLDRIRDHLSPSWGWTRIPMAGRRAQIKFVRSEFVDVDVDATITGTSRHPAVGVDTYRLHSQPT